MLANFAFGHWLTSLLLSFCCNFILIAFKFRCSQEWLAESDTRGRIHQGRVLHRNHRLRLYDTRLFREFPRAGFTGHELGRHSHLSGTGSAQGEDTSRQGTTLESPASSVRYSRLGNFHGVGLPDMGWVVILTCPVPVIHFHFCPKLISESQNDNWLTKIPFLFRSPV